MSALVCRLKSIHEIHDIPIVARDDAELSRLLIGDDVEPAVLVEAVEQKNPETDIVDVVCVQQNAFVLNFAVINHIVYCSAEIMLLLKFFQGLLGIFG